MLENFIMRTGSRLYSNSGHSGRLGRSNIIGASISTVTTMTTAKGVFSLALSSMVRAACIRLAAITHSTHKNVHCSSVSG